jgi:hypothetical protein
MDLIDGATLDNFFLHGTDPDNGYSNEPVVARIGRQIRTDASHTAKRQDGIAYTISLSSYVHGKFNRFGEVKQPELLAFMKIVAVLYQCYKKIDRIESETAVNNYSTGNSRNESFDPDRENTEKFFLHHWKTEDSRRGFTFYMIDMDTLLMDFIFDNFLKLGHGHFQGYIKHYVEYIGAPLRPVNNRSHGDEELVNTYNTPLSVYLSYKNAESLFKDKKLTTSEFYTVPTSCMNSNCFPRLFLPWQQRNNKFNETMFQYLMEVGLRQRVTIRDRIFRENASPETMSSRYRRTPLGIPFWITNPDKRLGVIGTPTDLAGAEGNKMYGMAKKGRKKQKNAAKKKQTKKSKKGKKNKKRSRDEESDSESDDDDERYSKKTKYDSEDEVVGITEEDEEAEAETTTNPDTKKVFSRMEFTAAKFRGEGTFSKGIRDEMANMEKDAVANGNSSIYPFDPIDKMQGYKNVINVSREFLKNLFADTVSNDEEFTNFKTVANELYDSFLSSEEAINNLPRGGLQALFEYATFESDAPDIEYNYPGESLLYNVVGYYYKKLRNVCKLTNIMGNAIIGFHQSLAAFRIVPFKPHHAVSGRQGMGKTHYTEKLEQLSLSGLFVSLLQMGSDKSDMTHNARQHIVMVYGEGGPEFHSKASKGNDAASQRRANMKQLLTSSFMAYTYFSFDDRYPNHDPRSRVEAEIKGDVHRCVIVCANFNIKGTESALADRFSNSNQGNNVKECDAKSLAAAKQMDTNISVMLEKEKEFGDLVKATQFLCGSSSMFKNAGASVVDVMGTEECSVNVAHMIVNHIMFCCEKEGIDMSNTRDTQRIVLYASSIAKWRVAQEILRHMRTNGLKLKYGKGGVNSNLLRDMESKLVVTLEDIVFAISLVPPPLFNPMTKCIMTHVRDKYFKIGDTLKAMFRLDNNDPNGALDDNTIQYVDLTKDDVATCILNDIVTRSKFGNTCLKMKVSAPMEAPQKGKKKKDNDSDKEPAKAEIDPNYIGIKMNIFTLCRYISQTSSVKPSAEDVQTILTGLKSTPIKPTKVYKKITKTLNDMEISESDLEPVDEDGQLIDAVLFDRSDPNVVYFSLASLCCNKDVGLLYNIIQREFSYKSTRPRKLPVFDHDSQDVKFIELKCDESKDGFTFTLACAKIDPTEYVDVVERLLEVNPSATIADHPFLALSRDGEMKITEDPDDFAYAQHLKNIHADADAAERVKAFRKCTESIPPAYTTARREIDMERIKKFDPAFKCEQLKTQSIEDTRALPQNIDQQTMFVPVRAIDFTG